MSTADIEFETAGKVSAVGGWDKHLEYGTPVSTSERHIKLWIKNKITNF